MTLDELLNTVQKSDAEDWHCKEITTVYGWESGAKQGVPFLEPITHHNFAVYKGDVDISLVFGATINNDFQEAWHCGRNPAGDPSLRPNQNCRKLETKNAA